MSAVDFESREALIKFKWHAYVSLPEGACVSLLWGAVGMRCGGWKLSTKASPAGEFSEQWLRLFQQKQLARYVVTRASSLVLHLAEDVFLLFL